MDAKIVCVLRKLEGDVRLLDVYTFTDMYARICLHCVVWC